ncbi:chromosome segregation protein SMC [Palleronia sp. LCG004]|uniref:chromosome segregation protein SMC n=1 Tax=Palleronia sp. LCG004 TaxID=3079304 RepID=UPI0029427F7B|nr:chromosome segregation protein SMC [Palleronia sp. LCG004]WOI55750.1 chromosome segregation protein SMC [Palleronia sp. LCG004]
MRFTKLRLNGFKSFVDPTDLVIHDGLTGVVGPNGCGKSNLLEALRWVMGENRPTAMRGGGMEDVIFAGTSSRSARNFAEVAIHIDNSERLAPAAFNDTDQIEIIRRITRDAGSAFKAAGRDVRARDVQMLFADASTGSQSPALVRQGQISELINAKPKSRRRVLEEAAGISGLYQRRHEAELKLKGAEANLARLDDVIDQMAQQLSQLARQAKQAARYREIGARLREAEGLLLYRRWREADTARAVAVAEMEDRVARAGEAERAARQAVEAREAAEIALPPLREEDSIAAAILQRLQVERATLDEEATRAERAIETLEARLEQIARDGAREEALNADAGESIDRLMAEAAELTQAGEGAADALSEAEGEAETAARILADREGDLGRMTEEVARLAARHQSAERLVAEGRTNRDRAEAAASKARTAVEEAEAALSRAGAAQEVAEGAQGDAQARAEAAEAALAGVEASRAEIQSREAEARAARSEIEGELGAIRAEAAALEKLVARGDDAGDQLVDALSVAPGYEAALGAALADDLRARVSEEGSGWRTLPDYDEPQALPAGVGPLAAQVKMPDLLARRLAQVGIVEAGDGARLQADLKPGQRLVSREGDLWRWDGLCARAADAPSAEALRLQQVNRLEALRADLAGLEARASEARDAHEAIGVEAKAQSRAEADAREARRAADASVAALGRDLSRAEADRNIADGKLESARLAVARHDEEAGAARKAMAEAEAQRDGLDDLDALRARVEDLKIAVEAARIAMLSKRSAHDELDREIAARERRQTAIEKELAGWRGRLGNADSRLADLARRREATETELAAARSRPAELKARRETLDRDASGAEARRVKAAEALSAAESALTEAARAERDTERAAGEAREARASAGARRDAAGEAAEAAAHRIEEALDTTPAQLLEGLGADPEKMPPANEIEAEIARLRQQRDAMGAVNLRAEEDASEIEGEHSGLVAEKADLEGAIAELRRGIAGLNREGRERLLAAFERVNENFGMLFKHLFGGGEARLELVESDDPLDAGLEILCSPPGKRLSTLSLLSGGEQTLTAMALIFAVFLANPAPICVLDEVDAPLDDANVTRFCDMLDEMCRQTETRFLIITHHAVTMARMDRLFGVTMGEQGVSQLVSVDLKKAEAMVA